LSLSRSFYITAAAARMRSDLRGENYKRAGTLREPCGNHAEMARESNGYSTVKSGSIRELSGSLREWSGSLRELSGNPAGIKRPIREYCGCNSG